MCNHSQVCDYGCLVSAVTEEDLSMQTGEERGSHSGVIQEGKSKSPRIQTGDRQPVAFNKLKDSLDGGKEQAGDLARGGGTVGMGLLCH